MTAFPHGDIFTEVLLSGKAWRKAIGWRFLRFPGRWCSWVILCTGRSGSSPGRRFWRERTWPAIPAVFSKRAKPASLLALVECVGPAGSATPALTATVGPEFGLAAASGSVMIPALKAGESALIKIPSVTAGADPTGMFRLA